MLSRPQNEDDFKSADNLKKEDGLKNEELRLSQVKNENYLKC